VFRCLGRFQQIQYLIYELQKTLLILFYLNPGNISFIIHSVNTLLAQPDVVLAGLKAVESDSAQVDHFEQELADVKAKLKGLDEQQKKLLKQSLMGFPEELVIKENQKFNGDRALLLERKAELEAKIGQTQRAAVDMDNIKLACEIVSQKLGSLTYEDKRLALKALDIKVWIKHNELIMEGSIPMSEDLSNLTVTSRCSESERVEADILGVSIIEGAG